MYVVYNIIIHVSQLLHYKNLHLHKLNKQFVKCQNGWPQVAPLGQISIAMAMTMAAYKLLTLPEILVCMTPLLIVLCGQPDSLFF